MEFTAAASWLNSFFAGFDSIILGFMNTLADSAGSFLTPVMKLITLLGEKGLAMFLLSFILMVFPKTRKAGVCIFGAVCCGALITNIILKDLIARPRPFEAMARFAGFWKELGSPAESGYSFPSGHMTAITAGMCALCFTKGKKFVIPTVLVVLLMGVSRCYLMAHFPSDVLAGILVGLVSALIAWLIANLIFNYCEDNDDLPFFEFVLYFDPVAKIPALNTLLGRDGSKVSSRRRGRRASSHSKARRSAPAMPRLNIKLPGKAAGKHGSVRDLPVDAPAEAPVEDELIRNEGAESTELPPAEEVGEGTSRFSMPAMPKLNVKLPQRPKRPTEDWNDRWNEYRSRKDSEKNAAASDIQSVQEEVHTVPAPAEGDEDMKIAAPKAKAPVEGDEDVKIAVPRGKAEAGVKPAAVQPVQAAPAPAPKAKIEDEDDEPVKLDADAALLAEINFRDARMDGQERVPAAPEDQPSRRRESVRSSRPASSKRSGGYRGKHEK